MPSHPAGAWLSRSASLVYRDRWVWPALGRPLANPCLSPQGCTLLVLPHVAWLPQKTDGSRTDQKGARRFSGNVLEKEVLPDWIREHEALKKIAPPLPEKQKQLVTSLVQYRELRQQSRALVRHQVADAASKARGSDPYLVISRKTGCSGGRSPPTKLRWRGTSRRSAETTTPASIR